MTPENMLILKHEFTGMINCHDFVLEKQPALRQFRGTVQEIACTKDCC